MAELKELRAQSEELLNRAKELSNKVYLAGLGAYEKGQSGSEELYGKFVTSGTEAFGDDAEKQPKAVLAARGLFINTKNLLETVPEKRVEFYEKLVAAGKEQRGEKADASNEFVLAGFGAVITVRDEAQKLFKDLVAAGEQNKG